MMERTIDRTSYRRSLRNDYQHVEVNQEVSKSFILLNFFLNKVIVSIALIIGAFTTKYFEIAEVENWIKENLTGEYSITTLYAFIKNKFESNKTLFGFVGASEYSGDVSGENSGEISGELLGQVAFDELDGISGDAKYIKENFNLIVPVKGVISSGFGARESTSELVSSYHTGVDIAIESGTDIRVAHDGTVIMAKAFSTYGNCIMVENGKLVTVYAHCSKIDVTEGQKVEQGDVIGKVGMTGNATGPHLHFEIRCEDRFVNPLDILEEI